MPSLADSDCSLPLVLALKTWGVTWGVRTRYQCVLLPTREVRYTGNLGSVKGLFRTSSVAWRDSAGDAIGRVDIERVWMRLNCRVFDAANREVLAIDETCRHRNCWPAFDWQMVDRRWFARPRLENQTRFLDLSYEDRLVATIVDLHYVIRARLISQHSSDARKLLCAIYVHDAKWIDLAVLMTFGFSGAFGYNLN